MSFNKFDLVYRTGNSDIHVVLVGPLDIPYFHDGIASDFAFQPLDPTDPEEWERSFEAYITFNLSTTRHEIVNEWDMRKCDGCFLEGYIPFDQGTSKLRVALGLIRLAEKWWGGKHSGYLDSHLAEKHRKKDTEGE